MTSPPTPEPIWHIGVIPMVFLGQFSGFLGFVIAAFVCINLWYAIWRTFLPKRRHS